MGNLKVRLQGMYDAMADSGTEVDEILDTYVAQDFVEHEAMPGSDNTRETPRRMFHMMRAAFPDVRIAVHDMIEEGDKVVARIEFIGTHQGEFMGVPATGKALSIKAMDICQFRDDKMVAHWGLTDMAGVMEQMGVGGPPG